MKLLLLTCAETVVTDQATNHASLVNLLEEVITPTFPIAIFKVAVFTLWEREGDEQQESHAELTAKLNAAQLFQTSLTVNFQQAERCRAVMVVQGVVLNEPGNLFFEVSLGGHGVGTWRVPVRTPEGTESRPTVS